MLFRSIPGPLHAHELPPQKHRPPRRSDHRRLAGHARRRIRGKVPSNGSLVTRPIVGLHADLGALKPGTPGGEYGERCFRMEALSPEPGSYGRHSWKRTTKGNAFTRAGNARRNPHIIQICPAKPDTIIPNYALRITHYPERN